MTVQLRDGTAPEAALRTLYDVLTGASNAERRCVQRRIRDGRFSARRHGPVHDRLATHPLGQCGHVVRQMN